MKIVLRQPERLAAAGAGAKRVSNGSEQAGLPDVVPSDENTGFEPATP